MVEAMFSSEKKEHHLSCQKSLIIEIKEAWVYLNMKCWRYVTDTELSDLRRTCNGNSECKFEIKRLYAECGYSQGLTRSVIEYDCMLKHLTTENPTTTQPYQTTVELKENRTESYISTTSQKTFTSKMIHSDLTNRDDAVIAGSVLGVLGVLALVLLLIYFVFKRRKVDRNKNTRSGSVTNAVGQNSNVLYNVPDIEPPPYNNLDNISVQNHIYTNDDYDLNHQDTDNYNHIHGTVIRKSLQTDDYNHTDTEAVNVSGRQREDYNHIAVNGQSGNVPTVMEDDYNHIRSTEGAVSHGTSEYNHIGGLTDGEEKQCYLEDDYNHLDDSYLQNSFKRGQPGSKGDQGISNMSKLENNYDNIGIKGDNNDGDDFEPDDTYVYT